MRRLKISVSRSKSANHKASLGSCFQPVATIGSGWRPIYSERDSICSGRLLMYSCPVGESREDTCGSTGRHYVHPVRLGDVALEESISHRYEFVWPYFV